MVRIGYGEDAHQLAPGRALWIGGVCIENSPHGAVAHSDGDVLLHALADALLSSQALGDIGDYYPPSDARYKDMDSRSIVQGVCGKLAKHWQLHNVAAVVTLDSPKLGSYRQAIAEAVAALLSLEPTQVGITFKTSEGLAPQHIQARVSVLLSVSTASSPGTGLQPSTI